MNRRSILSGIALLAASEAGAQEPAAFIDRARLLLGDGKATEAARTLEEALVALAAKMPLTVRAAVLVDQATAYGDYKPRASNVFQPTDELKLYIEPMGFTYTQADGRYRIEFAGDYEIRAAGQAVVGQKDFARFTFDSARPNREFYLQISYSFEHLRPGDYTIVTHLHDKPSGKAASFETPIRIASDDQGPTGASGKASGKAAKR